MKSTSIVTSSVVALLVGILVTVPVSAQDRTKPKTASSSESAGSGITKDQADGILDELRQIRQLLEKQQAQLDRVVTPQPSVPGAPEKVQMSVKSTWRSLGRADAPITLVEFADYECPFCKGFHAGTYAELKKNYIDTGKVRFVSRDLPLEFHPTASSAAEAVRCAGDQDKYWQLRDALLANPSAPNNDVIKKAAESLSIEMKGFQACLDSNKYKSEVQEDAAEAATLHLMGTPSFVLGRTSQDKLDGIVLVGAQPYDSFDSAIQKMLKDAVNRTALSPEKTHDAARPQALRNPQPAVTYSPGVSGSDGDQSKQKKPATSTPPASKVHSSGPVGPKLETLQLTGSEVHESAPSKTAKSPVPSSSNVSPVAKTTSDDQTPEPGNRGAATFIENKAQWDEHVRFQLTSGAKTLWLTNSGVVFDNLRAKTNDQSDSDPELKLAIPDRSKHLPDEYERLVFSEDFINANSAPRIEASAVQPGKYNYLAGSDPAKWHTGVRSYATVIYRNVWDGVDVKVAKNGTDIEQEFLVHPGADLNRVQVAYRGIDGLDVAKDGSLLVRTDFGELRETPPRIYQEIAGRRVAVEGRFKLLSKVSYTFEVSGRQKGYALVVDPTLLYSTFLGGSAGNNFYTGNNEYADGIAVDATGDAYVTGYTASTDFPTTSGAFQSVWSNSSLSDIFITKLNSSGSALIYSTYLSGASYAKAIAIDPQGNAYVTGYNAGNVFGFPTTPNAFSQSCSASGFLTVLNPTGSSLLYSTCFGSSNTPSSLAVDSKGRAFIAGTGGTIPTTANAYQTSIPGVQQPAFVTVLDTTLPGAASLVYSTYFGAPGNSSPYGVSASAIAVDSFGNIYITGFAGIGMPVTPGAFQPSVSGVGPCNPFANAQVTCPDAFVAKFNPSAAGAQSLIYSTYLGGPGNTVIATQGNGIAVDSTGSAYVTGLTGSSGFPVTPGAFQTTSPAGLQGATYGAFVSKFNASGSNLIYSTYVNGNSPSSGDGIAVDSLGNAYVAGNFRAGGVTNAFFPVTPDAFQSTFTKLSGDFQETFLAKLNPAGSALIYSSYLGGSGDDEPTAVAVDQTGDAYVTGHTSSVDFPVSSTAFQPSVHGTGDAFVTKFPLGGTFRALQVAPNTGGNAGVATPTLFGSGLHNGVALTLRGSGPDIIASRVTVGPYGLDLNATFDLHGAVPAARDVIVTNTDGTTVTLPQAFTVTGGGSSNLTVAITSPLKILSSLTTDFYITVSNSGNVDAVGVPFWFAGIPDSWSLGLDFAVSSPPQFTSAPNPDISDTPIVVKTPTLLGQVVPLFISSIPAGSHITLHFQATPHSLVGPAVLAAWVNPPYFHSPLDPNASTCLNTLLSVLVGRITGLIPVTACVQDLSALTTLLYTTAVKGTVNQVFSTVQFYSLIMKSTTNCGVLAVPEAAIVNGVITLAEQISDYADLVSIAADCSGTFLQAAQQQLGLQSVGSFDPNGLVGTLGVGSARYISPKQALTYAIYFQNLPTATAPAHNVTVVQPVDPGVDLNTFKLNSIDVAGLELPIPGLNPSGGVTAVQTTLDLRPTESVLVYVSTELDVAGRTITWTFTSIDPATGLPTTDPAAGFLPAGAEGSVSYSIMPSQTATTGQLVDAQATIVFDANPAMTTQVWVNTIDNTPPTSHIAALPPNETSTSFTVAWSGTDVGAGIQDYTIYVSDNGAAYAAFQTNITATSATFTGQLNHTYTFYSIARDLVGNVEPAKTTAEAATTVSASPPDYTLSESTSTLTLAAGQSGTVTITVTPQGYSGPLNFSCGSIPSYLSCMFNPSNSISVGGTAPATVQLTVNVAATVSQLEQGKFNLFGVALPLGVLGFLLPSKGNRKRWKRYLRILTLGYCLSGILSGCNGGGGSSAGTAPKLPPPGTQTITLTASGSGGISHQLPMQVTITN